MKAGPSFPLLICLFASGLALGQITSTEVVVVTRANNHPSEDQSANRDDVGALIGTGGPHTSSAPDSADFIVGGVGTREGTTELVTITSVVEEGGKGGDNQPKEDKPTTTFRPGDLGAGDGDVLKNEESTGEHSNDVTASAVANAMAGGLGSSEGDDEDDEDSRARMIPPDILVVIGLALLSSLTV